MTTHVAKDWLPRVPLLAGIMFCLLFAVGLHAGAAVSFDEQLARHFKAIQSRDLATLEDTLTSGAALELILPSGKRLTTKDEFIALHEEWFASTTWSMQFEPLTRVETAEMAVATVRARYEDIENGQRVVRHNWLTLTFRKESGRWALVHDQNTRIAE